MNTEQRLLQARKRLWQNYERACRMGSPMSKTRSDGIIEAFETYRRESQIARTSLADDPSGIG